MQYLFQCKKLNSLLLVYPPCRVGHPEGRQVVNGRLHQKIVRLIGKNVELLMNWVLFDRRVPFPATKLTFSIQYNL